MRRSPGARWRRASASPAPIPGTPSSEIIGTLAEVAKDAGIYVEWSVNEKVALEAAAAASFAGVRSIVAMKQNGLNVALDFLMGLALTGTNAGLVLVTCDDPGALSSTEEEDSRPVAKWACLPLLEPAHLPGREGHDHVGLRAVGEAEDVCLLRGVTRTSHARGDVRIGERAAAQPSGEVRAVDTAAVHLLPPPLKHGLAHQKMDRAREIFEDSPFNWYEGPEEPDLLIVTCGSGWFYSLEAVKALDVERNGRHPQARHHLAPAGEAGPASTFNRTEKVLVVEEIDPFLEGNLKELVGEDPAAVGPITFYGKRSGHIPIAGEINPDIVTSAISRILEKAYVAVEPTTLRRRWGLPVSVHARRMVGFCAGCPHRATFWSVKNALKLDGRGGFVTGDIGCYTMALGPTGFWQLKTAAGDGLWLPAWPVASAS